MSAQAGDLTAEELTAINEKRWLKRLFPLNKENQAIITVDVSENKSGNERILIVNMMNLDRGKLFSD